jgi:hypothetical protein
MSKTIGETVRAAMGLLNEEELSAMLGHKSLSTVRFWRTSGQGPVFTRLGKTPFYRVADVEAWIAGGRTQPGPGGSAPADVSFA